MLCTNLTFFDPTDLWESKNPEVLLNLHQSPLSTLPYGKNTQVCRNPYPVPDISVPPHAPEAPRSPSPTPCPHRDQEVHHAGTCQPTLTSRNAPAQAGTPQHCLLFFNSLGFFAFHFFFTLAPPNCLKLFRHEGYFGCHPIDSLSLVIFAPS